MPRGGFSKRARNERWARLYGTPTGRTLPNGRPEVWTYRRLAKQYAVTPNTVWFALHPEAQPKRYERAGQPAREARPLSIRVALSRAEHAAVRAAAEKGRVSMMELARRGLFAGSPPLVVVPLEGEPELGLHAGREEE